MKEAKESDNPALLRRTFTQVCASLQPAFRFFFLEYFASGRIGGPSSSSSSSSGRTGSALSSACSLGDGGGASDWWRRRLAYAESLAVSSMVGHVMGIGDRHTQNILVDTKSAEVVHIDFGIVFEQGKTLSTPETVPFRLTRDMVTTRLWGGYTVQAMLPYPISGEY